MNILCISKYASPPKYGVAARLFYLAKEMVKEGHNVTLMTSDSNHLAKYPSIDEKNYREIIDGVDVIWFKNYKYLKTASISRILSWFSFEFSLFSFPKNKLPKPDIVIVSSLSLLSVVYGYYLKRYFKVPLVFEVRDIWPLTLTAEGGFSKWHPLSIFLAVLEKFAYSRSDLIVGTMPKLDLHVYNVLGYSKECFCSPLGFDQEVMASRDAVVYSELKKHFPANKVIIGYAGSMGTSNNLDAFIDVIDELQSESNLHFVLVGAGDLRTKYETRLKNCKNVNFVSRISPEMVPAFLNECDVLYLSTHDSEVWDYGQSMNKVVEYMYAAKPVVASYSGYPSMIDESGSGVFVRANDKETLKFELLQMSKMSTFDLEIMGKKGNNWIRKHRDYSVLAKDYLDRLRRLIES